MKNVLDTGDIRAEVELESTREDLGFTMCSVLCLICISVSSVLSWG